MSTGTVLQRFWDKVDTSGECWIWQGYRSPFGYGAFAPNHGDVPWRAHRYSYVMMVGPIGDNWVLHHCDNPPCVRPDHLYLGTPKHNARDRDTRGRANTPYGERHGGARLNEDAVRAIRKLAKSGVQQQHIAKRFGISEAMTSLIVRGKKWRHVV